MARYRDFDPNNLHYDPDTGVFTWLVSTRKGRPAGSPNKDGYLEIRVFPNKKILLHRLAFVYMTGRWPERHVDHKNRVRADNRWSNLREATHTENQQNMKPRLDTKTPGAGFHASRGQWRARIKVDKREIFLGYFASAEDASKAYLDAKRRLHPTWTETGSSLD